MDLIQVLSKAIETQKTVCFEYTKFGKIFGERYGNPHCLFIHPKTDNVMIHIFQIGGVSDTKHKIPGWRTHILMHIDRVKILSEQECFEISQTYNPNSHIYSRVISKI